jgi:hypothetical protein
MSVDLSFVSYDFSFCCFIDLTFGFPKGLVDYENKDTTFFRKLRKKRLKYQHFGKNVASCHRH